MKIQNDRLLVRTPSVSRGESLLSYLLRLSNINGMNGISAILRKSQYSKLLAEGFLQKWLLGKVDLEFVSKLTGDKQNEIKLRYENQPRLVNRSTYSVYRPKFCPVCIAQYGYIPLHNEYIQQLICPTHQVVLIDKCHKCQLRIGWQRKFLEKCNCGEPFKNQPLLLPEKELFRLFIENGLVSDENGVYDDDKLRRSAPIWQNVRCLLRPLDAIPTDVDFEYVANERLYSAVLNSLLILAYKGQPNLHIDTIKRYKEKQFPLLVATGLPALSLNRDNIGQTNKNSEAHRPIYYTPLPSHGQISGIVRSHELDLHLVSNHRILSANSRSIKQCTTRSIEDRLSAQACLITVADALHISTDKALDLVDDGWFDGMMNKRRTINGRLFDLFLINLKLEELRDSSRSIRVSAQLNYVNVTDSDSLSNFNVRLSKLLNSQHICVYKGAENAGFESFCVSIDVLENALMHGILQDKLMDLDDAAAALSTKPILVYLLNQNNFFRIGQEIYIPNKKSVSMLALQNFKRDYILLNSVAAANQICVDEISALLIQEKLMPYKRIYWKDGCIFLYENTTALWRQINDIIKKNRLPKTKLLQEMYKPT